MIKVRVRQNGEERTILFSGDIGSWDKPILRDPTLFEEADYVFVESTYGDRLMEPPEDASNKLAEVINTTAKAGGNIVIPSFALERSQEILYYLNKFLLEDRIPHLMVFVDSPMAVSITEVFEHHPELFDEEMLELMRQKKSPFDFPGLNLVQDSRRVEGDKSHKRDCNYHRWLRDVHRWQDKAPPGNQYLQAREHDTLCRLSGGGNPRQTDR